MNNPIKILLSGILLFSFLTTAQSITPDELLRIDLKKEYKNYKVYELRLIRSMVYARHGYLFMESELRDYFVKNYKWYEELIWKNATLIYEKKTVPPIVLSLEEKNFVDKIDGLIVEKSKKNFFQKDTLITSNIDNVANEFYDRAMSENFTKCLKNNGFVIEEDQLEQLFHLYDKNNYSNTPSFITTDLFLQLYHIYFSYILKDLEKEKLTNLVSNLTLALYNESMKYSDSPNQQIKEMANFNTCFFAVAYTLLTDKRVNVPDAVSVNYALELDKVKAAKNSFSSTFNAYIAYSLCKPRGYYTRTPEQQRYFKAMMWLQLAPYCLSNRDLLKNACFNAFLLKYGKQTNGKPIKDLYNAVYAPIAFLVGDADNLSINDICTIYEKNDIKVMNFLSEPKIIDVIANKLTDIVAERDKITPKIKLDCQPKINFMPQRYLVDNDILQQFVDTAKNAEKAFPKGLEVMDVLGVGMADNLLYKHYKENRKWKDYDSVTMQQKEKFRDFNDWDKTVYNKWLQGLIKLNKVEKEYPTFMHSKGWSLKNLNTSLASWAQLKHDVVLYAEEPSTAEMGGGGEDGPTIPDPITVGYVEPNIEFWNTSLQLLKKNEWFLYNYNLMTDELKRNTASIRSILDFFITATNKELEGDTLTQKEYDRIKTISGEFDYLSLSMLNPYLNLGYWDEVTGPDKTVALAVDVYTRNVPRCPKNAILHEATGYGNTIHVLVEINGLLYLTRGAVFSYYEFPFESRLTDEEWLEMLKKKEIAPVDWMNDLTIPGEKKVK